MLIYYLTTLMMNLERIDVSLPVVITCSVFYKWLNLKCLSPNY